MADEDTEKNVPLGYFCCFLAILFFGTNYIPVKKFDAGDGFFFQWILCIGIWVTGWVCGCAAGWPDITTNILKEDGNGSQRLQIIMSLGGALWAAGNVVVVPVISSIGLGVGMCIWCTANMICGWLSGISGKFGVSAELDNLLPGAGLGLNITGALFTVAAGIFYFLIEPNVDAQEEPKDNELRETTGTGSTVDVDNEAPAEKEDVPETSAREIGFGQRITGIVLAVIAGCFYGFNFNPVFGVKETFQKAPLFCNNGAPKLGPNYETCKKLGNVFSYVFWHFTGILLFSTGVFLVYCVYKKNKPFINPSIILPAFVSGAMWAIAQICWFYANDALGHSTAFPLITSGPGAVSVLCGIFLFKEIQGKRNFIYLGCAFACVICAALFIVFSRKSQEDIDAAIAETGRKLWREYCASLNHRKTYDSSMNKCVRSL